MTIRLINILLYLTFILSFGEASANFASTDRDTTKSIRKYRSIYDTSSIYYNKGKINLNLETGTSDLSDITPTLFGQANPNYHQESFFFAGFAADYGINEKATIGFGLTYQYLYYNPVALDWNYNNGSLTAWTFTVRYTHCIWSWKYFYYGVQVGGLLIKPDFSPNTFLYYQSSALIRFDAGILGGARINIGSHINIHTELVFNFPVGYADFGITYRIIPHKH